MDYFFIWDVIVLYYTVYRVGNWLIVFAKKSEQMSDSLKSERFAHFWWATWAIRSQLLIPSERPEQIAQSRLFVLTNLSDSLTWLRRNERIFCFFKIFFKNCKNIQKYDFFVFFSANCSFLWAKEQTSDSLKKKSDSLICLFIMSDLS